MKLISSKKFIGQTLENSPIDISDFIRSIYDWIECALGQIGLVKYYPLTHKVIDIKSHKGELPCDYNFVHSAWIRNNCGCTGGWSYLNLTGSPFIGNCLDLYTKAGNKGSLEGNYIHTDIDNGKILLVYRAVPQDDEGYPMIPDNAFLTEALNYYIIHRLALKGIEHPIIKFNVAYEMWERLYPRAGNDIEWFSLPELEEFTRMWNNPLIGNITDNLYIN